MHVFLHKLLVSGSAGLIVFTLTASAQSHSNADPLDKNIKDLEIANHKLYSSYHQPKNSLEAYWAFE
jgi:hypothetical protein